MAIAELARKNPFEVDEDFAPIKQGEILTKVITIALVGFVAFYVRQIQDDNDYQLGLIVLGVIFTILVFKDTIYGLVGIFFAIGVSPDSVGMNNVRLEDYLLPPILIIWFLKKKANGSPFGSSEIFSNVRFYLIVALIATIKGLVVNSIRVEMLALVFYLKYVEYFVMMYLAFDVLRKKEDYLIVILVSLVTCAFVAYISYQGRARIVEETARSYVRAKGPEGETPNVLGGYFLSHIMMAFALMFALRNYFFKIAIFGILMAIVVPLLYTYSRTTFVSMVVGLVITCVFIDFRFIFILGVLFVFQQLLIPSTDGISQFDEHFVDRYSSIFNVFGDDGDRPSSWRARVIGWYIFYSRTWSYDPLLGMGVGSIGLGIDSSYVKKFAESGIIGFIVFIMLLVRLGRLGYEVAKSKIDPFLRYLAIGYMGCLASISVHALGVCSFSTIRSAEPFWLFSGMMVSIHFIMREREELEYEEAKDRENLRLSDWSSH